MPHTSFNAQFTKGTTTAEKEKKNAWVKKNAQQTHGEKPTLHMNHNAQGTRRHRCRRKTLDKTERPA
jgi:hypothetical protein